MLDNCDLTKRERKMISEVLEWFDFERVHRIMDCEEWKWAMYDTGTTEVPSIGKLMLTAQTLLIKVVSNPNLISVGTGGLRAYKTINPDDESDYSLHLVFEAASSYSDPAEENY
jgi:hypothetical protein